MKKKWAIGSVFCLSLPDKDFVIGKVIGIEPDALNSFVGMFYRTKFKKATPFDQQMVVANTPISVQFTTKDSLDSGIWPVIGETGVEDLSNYFKISQMRENGFVGTKVIGSGIMTKFMEAMHGFFPWDGCADPNYFENLLLSKSLKPAKPLMKNTV